MIRISETEARTLLLRPLKCDGVEAWAPSKVQRGIFECGGDVVDEHGKSARMYVLLTYRHTQKTRTITYKFTLFKRLPYATERVYQLEVTQTPRRMADAHKLSHEHMGDIRRLGHASWASWGYHDVLAHFCDATNITFVPVPSHPEEFQLTAD